MRVLLITKCYPPYSGGAAVNYKIFLDELSKMKKISKVNILTNYNKDCNVIENSINNKTNVIRILLDYQSYSNIIIKFLAFSIQVLQSLVIGLLIRLFKYYDLIQIHSDFLWASNGKILNPGVLFLSKSANKTVLDIRDKTSIPKMDYGYSHYFANSNYIFKKLKNNLRELKCSLIYSPIDFYEKALAQKNHGGVPLSKGAELALFLASPASDGITGKLISAIWDKWEDWVEHIDELAKSDAYTLRRISGRERGFDWGDV